MGGNVEAIKERLDIVEVVGQYVKLEKAGANWKGRCPFHNEKTPSFFVSPSRQSYNCFGCGKRGDIFTLVEELEGVDFKTALKQLAEKAGIELSYERNDSGAKDEKEKLFEVLEVATKFFEEGLKNNPEAKKYLISRGLNEETISLWRLGVAPSEWRALLAHLTALGYSTEVLLKAGLVRRSEDHKEKEPYDVFRGRIIFPIFDVSGRVIAFSGRALSAEDVAKYLNSPDTVLFQKSEVLYGLDKAKVEIRKKDYAVLVEGQLDLVLSHQAGVKNTVASSGTAFTSQHLERLKRLSPRLILAFDGDSAGLKAAERSVALALALELEVKIARMPEGKDPADLVKEDSEVWKKVLRESKQAIETMLEGILTAEKDARKAGKLIEQKILPLILLVQSAIERSNLVSLVSRQSGLKEEVILAELKRAKAPTVAIAEIVGELENQEEKIRPSVQARIEERLAEVEEWKKELSKPSTELSSLESEEKELRDRLSLILLGEERQVLQLKLERGEGGEDIAQQIETISKKLDGLKRKVV